MEGDRCGGCDHPAFLTSAQAEATVCTSRQAAQQRSLLLGAGGIVPGAIKLEMQTTFCGSDHREERVSWKFQVLVLISPPSKLMISVTFSSNYTSILYLFLLNGSITQAIMRWFFLCCSPNEPTMQFLPAFTPGKMFLITSCFLRLI